MFNVIVVFWALCILCLINMMRYFSSSAVAGTMIVDGGGVQTKTVKNIALAWILTLPVSIGLSGLLYWISLTFIVNS